MSRAVLILGMPSVAAKAIDWIRRAPRGTRLTFQGPKRSTDQNARMWAMLTDISEQKEHMGKKYKPERWKVIFMHALGQEVEFIPSLDGTTFIPIGHQSSELSVSEMIELQDLIEAWGAQNGVVFHAQELERAA